MAALSSSSSIASTTTPSHVLLEADQSAAGLGCDRSANRARRCGGGGGDGWMGILWRENSERENTKTREQERTIEQQCVCVCEHDHHHCTAALKGTSTTTTAVSCPAAVVPIWSTRLAATLHYNVIFVLQPAAAEARSQTSPHSLAPG